MRKLQFQTGNYYHLYNRGVDKRDIFCDDKDFIRFVVGMREFNRIETIGSLYEKQRGDKKLSFQRETEFLKHQNNENKLIELIAYCLNKNHYHFLLKQVNERGVEKFMHKISLGYTKYFNLKYSRSGSLFQGRYKAEPIKSVGKLIRLSCYINGNPEIHKICKAKDWMWSSYQDYLGFRNGTLCDKNVILKEFESLNEYQKVTDNVVKESRETKDELALEA